jgi:arylsulfatase A-like enzyme
VLLVAPKPLDGQSVWPALAEGGEIVERDAVLGTYGRGKLQLAYFSEQWKLVQVSAPRQELQFHLFNIRNDPNEESDLAAEYPEEFERLKAELNALPKVDPLALGEETPDMSEPGAPRAIEPDNRSVINPPYTETARTD